MSSVQPAIGQWYLHKELDRRFEVVGIDDQEGTIELQDEEGFLDEMDLDTWSNTELEFTAQPEDLTEVFDTVAEPDEADGGDAVDAEVIDPQALRVTDQELVGDSVADNPDEDADDEDADDEDAGEDEE